MKSALSSGVAVLVVALLACKGGNQTPQQEPVKSSTLAAPAREPKTPFQEVSEKTSLAAAFAYAKPRMGTSDNVGEGSLLLALWARQNLRWADVMALPEVGQKVVMKDPPSYFGKRLCAPGAIIEIHKNADSGLWNGGIFNGGFQVARFLAVGSTGELVQGSQARICGIVTGVVSYSNSAGGTTHAVEIVGMFDLPENKTAAP